MGLPVEVRFAKTCLENWAHEGRFDVAWDGYDVDALILAFEDLGCTVVRHPFRAVLKVTVPTPDKAQ